jgi:phosphonate transport system ATP-binding protein
MLEIKKITVSYGKDTPLNSASAKFEKGEVVAIIGKSGSGKSTLLNCLGLIAKPAQGQIFLNEMQIDKLTIDELRKTKRKIGIIFQHHNLISRLTVEQNIIIGTFGKFSFLRNILGIYPKQIFAEIKEIMNQVGLDYDLKNRRVDRQLSGGEMQRVAIARVLMQTPDIVLADEPTASLDQYNSEKIMELLIALNKGKTLIFNTHSVELAKKYASRIIGLNNGSIIYDKPTDLLSLSELEKIYS